MTNQILLIIGAILPLFWGTAHIFPMKAVIDGFGNISEDNKKILAMEWLNETILLYSIGFLVLLITIVYPFCTATPFVYIISAIGLISMAILSLLTGARTKEIPFKLCPVIFGSAAVLIILGSISYNFFSTIFFNQCLYCFIEKIERIL